MFRHRVFILFFSSCSLFLADSPTFGISNDGLGVFADVSDIRVLRSPAKSFDTLEIRLRLKLSNNSKLPQLFIKEINGEKVPTYIGLRIWQHDPANPLVSDFFGESWGRSARWKERADKLNVDRPDPDAFHVLQPGSFLEVERTLQIQLPNEASKHSDFPVRQSFEGLQQIGDLHLTVYFTTWAENLNFNSGVREFESTLRKRWRPWGVLVTRTLVASPITLSLKSVVPELDPKR